jgi:iron complex outermembrane receptor protein/outer membrane receptor for ferrienterochelin and colicins
MKQIIFIFLLLAATSTALSQYSFKVIVSDHETGQPLQAASVILKTTKQQGATNAVGYVEFSDIPAGKMEFVFSSIGYEDKTETIIFPSGRQDTMFVLLKRKEEEMEEVIVQSTRTSRTINNTPTRVETIDEEEIGEKSNMRPSNVSMLLHESTGLQVQQTSATSANASIRVQGLDGRYTQLLKDGYPNFGNFASGLSILEIPPLDLKQVEIIKGPASTLYGGGAIAGVINFISKSPKEKPEYNFLFNQSVIGQTNIGAYASHRKNKIGYTILGLVNLQQPYDVDEDDFSELPSAGSFTIHPRLFFYPSAKTSIQFGNSFTSSKNTGGDMHVIKGKPGPGHVYFEENKTLRNTTSFELETKLSARDKLVVRQSFSIFDRKIALPSYEFSGSNTNSYTEFSLVLAGNKHLLNTGINIIADRFKQKKPSDSAKLDNNSVTAGLYLQDTWDLGEKVVIESGIRADRVSYGYTGVRKEQWFILPRISTLFRFSNKLTSRITAGLGYKTPTVFTEQTESLQYRNVLPLKDVASERSTGFTADVNYKMNFTSELKSSINQLFFFTSIYRPLILTSDAAGKYSFINASKPVQSKGFETNLKLIFKDCYKLFVGYTFTNAEAKYLATNRFIPLLPKHKVNLALLYEKEKNIKLGLEGYFTGSQYLSSKTTAPAYWELGFFAEKTFGKLAVYVNFENFTDERQSKYKRVVNPPVTNPSFDEIWNHTEGFVVNGGLKFSL